MLFRATAAIRVFTKTPFARASATIAMIVAGAVANYRDADIEIEIASRDRFSIREVNESMVVSRLEDMTAARLLAAKLGLDPDAVVYQPLENNRDHASATLILGADYQRIASVTPTSEEIAH